MKVLPLKECDAISDVSFVRMQYDGETFLELIFSPGVGTLDMAPLGRVLPVLKRFAYSEVISVGRTDVPHLSWNM